MTSEVQTSITNLKPTTTTIATATTKQRMSSNNRANQQQRQLELSSSKSSTSSGSNHLQKANSNSNLNNNNNMTSKPYVSKRVPLRQVAQHQDTEQVSAFRYCSDSTSSDLQLNRNATNTSPEPDSDQVTASAGKPSAQQQQQHHVGPVMGIFFKVWSLVKVTKVRHNNQKLRRQNSEEAAAQFQYIAGDQLGGNATSRILEDAHFRRAGSQPAPTISGRAGRCEPLTAASASGYQQQQQHRQLALPANHSATNSSSSGVSSATGTTSSAQFRANTPTSGRRPATTTSTESPKGASTTSGWASKIKRSATTVNQRELSTYVSRYQLRRDRNHSVGPNASPVIIPELTAASGRVSGSARSFDDHQSEVLPVTMSTSEFDIIGRKEEEDSNDIYSTPNDSIQSVPGSAGTPLFNTTYLQQQQQQHSAHDSNFFPITKSFSTSNFKQLPTTTKHQHHYNNNNNQNQLFESIDETTTTTTSAAHLQRQDSIQSNTNEDDDELINVAAAPTTGKQQRSGSRFFISSSSSEDSTSPNQHLSSTAAAAQVKKAHTRKLISSNHHHDKSTTATNSGAAISTQQSSLSQESQQAVQLELCQRQVPVQNGVHYHNHLALVTRPDSLFCAANQSLGNAAAFVLPVSLITPTGAHLATAMSPHEHRFAYLREPTYRKSPSLFEMSSSRARILPGAFGAGQVNSSSRFSGKYPQAAQMQRRTTRPSISSFKPLVAPPGDSSENLVTPNTVKSRCSVPNSISLQDCKLSSQRVAASEIQHLNEHQQQKQEAAISEYKLAQMLLESGNNPNAKDSDGYTALMHAVLSDNVPAIKCLLEHKVNSNEVNNSGDTALDLICSKPATCTRLEILKLLIDNEADLDKTKVEDNSRLLDRLIAQHQVQRIDKLPYIDCLLQNGAKLGSSTWNAAFGKEEIQIRLLRKLCQDGYFLYKKSSIEAAVYRFEYALKRIAQLEQQLAGTNGLHLNNISGGISTHLAARQLKYQTYLGLSRCERKRRFFKRAIEFAHMAILIDSTSYEGYYSKAHILKDLGEIDDSIIAIDQTSRLVEKSIEAINFELQCLQQEEAQLFENSYNLLPVGDNNQQQQQQQQQPDSSWFESNRLELINNLEYMKDAKKYISRLKAEILEEKLRETSQNEQKTSNSTNDTFSTKLIAA